MYKTHKGTHPTQYSLTLRSISGTKVTQELVFPFAGPQDTYTHSKRPSAKDTQMERKKLDGSQLLEFKIVRKECD